MKDKTVILVVDDLPQNIELLEAYLVPEGYEIVKAANGEEALGKLSGNQIDLILLDVMMPGVDGFEVTRRVRQDDKHRLLPIILVTVLRETEDRVKGIEAGCDDFISMPVDKIELLARVRSLLKVKAYNDLMSNYRKELESEVTSRTEELKHTFIFQQRLIDALPVPVFYKDSEGKYLGCNSSFEKFFGQKREQVTGRSVYELSPKEFADIYREKDLALLQNPGIQIYESVVKDTDGVVHNVIFHKATFLNMDGSVGGLIGAILDITERIRAEEALRESEETARALVNATNDSVFLIDTAGTVLALNEITAKRLGKRVDEILGSYLYDFLPLDVAQRRKKRLDEVFHTGKPAYFEDERQGIWFDTCGYPILDAKGKVARLAIYGHDITERKRAEEALRENEEAARRVAQENKVIAEIGRVISSTLEIENVYGRFAEEVRKVIPFDRIVIDLVNADGNNATIRYIAGIEIPSRRIGNTFLLDGSLTGENVRTRSSLLIQGEDVAKIGKRYPDGLLSIDAGIQSFMGIPLISNDQVIGVLHLRSLKPNAYTESDMKLAESIGAQIAGAVANAQLFSERMRAEEALVTSEERYRTLFEGAAEGILVADIESKQFKYANPAICRMLGYTLEELTRLGVADIHPKEALDHVAAEFEAQASGRKILAPEIPCLQKDGSVIYTSIATTPVIIDGRKCNVGFFMDITERKESEKKMAALQEQFQQSQKMEAIGHLAGGIAHDFNNLLTIIKGYSQLSLMGLKEGNALKVNIEQIEKAANRAADLTGRILAFSRHQMMDMKVLNLNTIVENLEKMLYRMIGENIELKMYLAEDFGRVKTDAGQIEQVIMNLAVNAKDAMPDGGKLTIATANVELDETYARDHIEVSPGRYVMLSVSDTGVGMTPEVKERVFEPFFTTKKKGEGTGLGLSTVYGIVKQSGGHIWVYSEVGKGTTLKIYLPRVDEPLDEIRKEGVVREGLPRGSETILVVEDEEVVRKLTVRILQEQGYRVLEGGQGIDAFPIADEHEGQIHLLLTDVVMPKMGGKELAGRIASLRPGIKVLYMSGYTDNAIADHGILDKGINFIQKPFTVDGLVRKVREVLDK